MVERKKEVELQNDRRKEWKKEGRTVKKKVR